MQLTEAKAKNMEVVKQVVDEYSLKLNKKGQIAFKITAHDLIEDYTTP